MAVVKVPQNSTIAVKLQKGVTTSGSPAYVTRNYTAKSTALESGFVRRGSGIGGTAIIPSGRD